jgi:Uma2 family endonuclease
MVVQEKLYTAEELAQMPDNKHMELVEGVVVEMTASVDKHGVLSNEIGYLLTDYIKRHHIQGYVTVEGSGYILFRNPDTVRMPDVGFISKGRVPGKLTGAYFPAAPNLVVEIVSENDSATEVQKKVMEYLRAGTHLIWVFYPKMKSVVVHTPNGSHTVDADGALDGAPVLPGFNLSVREVFAVLDE